jgi:hypothetical protein
MFADAIMELLNFTGQTATLHTDGTVSRSANGMDLTRATVATTVRVAFRQDHLRTITGQIGESRRTCFMGARDLPVVPTKNDKIITAEGHEYVITTVDARKHGEQVIAYLLTVQGGYDA